VKKTTAHSQNILHLDALHNIKRKKYKTACAELTFAILLYKVAEIRSRGEYTYYGSEFITFEIFPNHDYY
jgi:hypothetical protein